MIEVYNRVKETSTTSGSGVIALNGATSGFQSFASVLSSGDKTYYTIVNKQNWEVGIGTYLSNSLQRSTILSSSNGGMPLNLSGSSNVFICYPSEKSVFKDENDRVVIGNSGIIFSDNSIQLTSFDVEKAQDAVGGILTNSSTINFSYNDNTPSISAVIPTGAITNDLIATGIDVSKLSGIINSSNLPSYVDDVLEYASFASLPPTGESGKIYLTIDTNRSYRWSGSQYVQITDTTALWGSITGTLADQTDLINYVVPQTRSVIAGTGLTGGGQLSSNVTLNLGNTAVTPGSYGSSSGVSSFTVDAQGRLTQASEVSINGLLPTGGSEGQILAKNSATNYDTGWIDNYAKELVQTIKNSTHTTLTKGQVVYISGADGTNPTISLAVASGEATSSKTLGFLKQDLNHGDIGYVITEGFLDGLNTNSATAEGDPIWLSPTVPGGVVYGLANTPYAPNHMVFLGFVVRKNINNGRIYIKVQNGFELKELHDVLAQSPSDGDIIRYVGSSGLWVSQPMPISYTDENAQDAVGNILTDTSSINFSYDDNLNTISAVVTESGVNHNLLSNYVANEHINHTGVLINAGTGLSGGGDISSSRTISIADTTVSSGNYGSSSQVGTFTVNSQGQLTAAANVSITPASIGALGSLNGLTDSTQTFQVGTTGTDFAVSSAAGVHTFNMPSASATARGVVTTGTQTFAGDKSFNGKVGVGGAGISSAGGPLNLPIYTWLSWGSNNILTGESGLLRVAGNVVASNYLGLGNNPADVLWVRDAADTMAQRRDTNPQAVRIYNTFTNSSNYERLALQFVTYSSARYAQLACESAGTGIANMNLVLSPRGTGALIAGPMPDGTATGGNARGARSVDLQLSRSAATQVASGANSFAVGTSCTASGTNSFAAGASCRAAGQSSISMGESCYADTWGNVAIGFQASAAGFGAIALGSAVCNASYGIAIGGRDNVSNGNYSVAIGNFVTSSGTYSVAFQQCTAGGNHSWAHGLFSSADRPHLKAYAQGNFASRGDAQSVEWVVRCRTTDGSTPVTLLAEASRMTIPSGKILCATMQLVGSKSDGTAVATYMRKFAIRNRAGTTELIGEVETIGTDVTAGTSFSLTADDTNDAINPSVIGVDGETWRWVAVVYGVELAYGT